MRINRNLLALALLLALAVDGAGCGGINASQTVSPATFFLPGLLKADSPSTNPPAVRPETSKELAFTR